MLGQLEVKVRGDWGGLDSRYVRIFEDVPTGEAAWVEYYCQSSMMPRPCSQIPKPFAFWRVTVIQLDIHLHSAEEVHSVTKAEEEWLN